jgi:hypothetical protein
MKRIRITAGNVQAVTELAACRAAEAIWNALPLRATGARWGKEIYFAIPVYIRGEPGVELVQEGDLLAHAGFDYGPGPTPALSH